MIIECNVAVHAWFTILHAGVNFVNSLQNLLTVEGSDHPSRNIVFHISNNMIKDDIMQMLMHILLFLLFTDNDKATYHIEQKKVQLHPVVR